MQTSEMLSTIKRGSRVVYEINGKTYSAMAMSEPNIGYNKALKAFSAFISLVYLDADGIACKVPFAALLGSQTDAAFIDQASVGMAKTDSGWHDDGVNNDDLIAQYRERIVNTPRTLGWRVETGDDLSAQVEQLRVQLAGCSVAALGWAKGEQKAKQGDYGWSASYHNVEVLREKYEELQATIQQLTQKPDGEEPNDAFNSAIAWRRYASALEYAFIAGGHNITRVASDEARTTPPEDKEYINIDWSKLMDEYPAGNVPVYDPANENRIAEAARANARGTGQAPADGSSVSGGFPLDPANPPEGTNADAGGDGSLSGATGDPRESAPVVEMTSGVPSDVLDDLDEAKAKSEAEMQAAEAGRVVATPEVDETGTSTGSTIYTPENPASMADVTAAQEASAADIADNESEQPQ